MLQHRTKRVAFLVACFLLAMLWDGAEGQYPPGPPACRSWYQECGIQRSYPCCGNMVCWRGRCINKKEDRKGYVYPPDNYFPPPWYFQRFVPVYPVNFRP